MLQKKEEHGSIVSAIHVAQIFFSFSTSLWFTFDIIGTNCYDIGKCCISIVIGRISFIDPRINCYIGDVRVMMSTLHGTTFTRGTIMNMSAWDIDDMTGPINSS
jgi:hypothetical protein